MGPAVRNKIEPIREYNTTQPENKKNEEWEAKKREIAEKVSRRTLLMDQAGILRSSEVLRFEQLKKAYMSIQELNDTP